MRMYGRKGLFSDKKNFDFGTTLTGKKQLSGTDKDVIINVNKVDAASVEYKHYKDEPCCKQFEGAEVSLSYEYKMGGRMEKPESVKNHPMYPGNGVIGGRNADGSGVIKRNYAIRGVWSNQNNNYARAGDYFKVSWGINGNYCGSRKMTIEK